jgi:hypothetical protein
MTIWKDLPAERAQRKRTGWSAHFAWGGFLTLLASRQTALGWALGASIIIGAFWELGWWTMARPRRPEDRASVLDWVFWILGAVAAAVLAIFWSK